MNLQETAAALARIRKTAPMWEAGEINAEVLLEAFRPLEERSATDPVVHDATRRMIQQGNYVILSPSRNHLVTEKDYEPHPGDTPEAKMRKESARMANIRNRRLLSEEHLVPQGDHPLEHTHIAYNFAKAARMSESLRRLGVEHVHATGGFREAGTDHPRGMIPTEASFVIRTGPKFGFHDAVNMAHEFGQDSFIHHGEETGHKPTLIQMKYHPETQMSPEKHADRFSVEPWSFDPHRVRAVTPARAHALSMGGKMVAFTHHWNPETGYPHHAPPTRLTRPAWRFVGGDEPSSRLDIPHR
jgi:hypothetical protein